MKTKHITRYSMPEHKFNGYRVAMTKKGTVFTKYISDIEAGSKEEAERIANKLRDLLLRELGKADDQKACMEKLTEITKEEILSL